MMRPLAPPPPLLGFSFFSEMSCSGSGEGWPDLGWAWTGWCKSLFLLRSTCPPLPAGSAWGHCSEVHWRVVYGAHKRVHEWSSRVVSWPGILHVEVKALAPLIQGLTPYHPSFLPLVGLVKLTRSLLIYLICLFIILSSSFSNIRK